MKLFLLFALTGCALIFGAASREKEVISVTVPVVLDHNRMLVDAEIQRDDGSWRKVRLWVDSGNPDLFMNESLARDLGIDLPSSGKTGGRSNAEVLTPKAIRIGGTVLNLTGVRSKVMYQPHWLFTTMHNDANLPSSVLMQYQVIFDYPKKQLTIATPGTTKPRGIPSKVNIHPKTGIVQMDAVIAGDSLSFALDNGASYSFVSEDKLVKLSTIHPGWPEMTGTAGCANMWGWWPPEEEKFLVMRVPDIKWGQVIFMDIGMVGVPKFSADGPTLGEWYSRKTAKPVDGFIGPNALMSFRVEIDYINSMIYFEKGREADKHDMDIVGLSVRQLADSSYQVVGIVGKSGKIMVEGVEAGDMLMGIGGFKTKGATMGKVVDALRGNPGEVRILSLERNGKSVSIEANVERCLDSSKE